MLISWKKNWCFFLLICFLYFLAAIFTPSLSQAQVTVTVPQHNPRDDDHNGSNKTITIGSGDSFNLLSADLSVTFESGQGPAPITETLNDLNAAGKVNDPNNILGQHTLELGVQNFGIAIPDPITGSPSTMSVYDSDSIALNPQAIGERTANVYDNVNNEQYIGLTIAKVEPSGGEMGVSFGSSLEDKASKGNHLNLAAKQSTLFKADGTINKAIINWNHSNRVTFFGVALNPNGISTVNAVGIPTFSGAFSVTTVDGVTHNQTVTDEASLKTYNDWLITELKAGNLKSNDYESLFTKAVTLTDKSLTYQQLATPPDEIFEPVGDRIIIHSIGKEAVTNINAKLEGQNATTAVKLDDGAKLVIGANGLLGNTNGHVVAMSGTSSTVNNGVINTNFLTNSAGSRESGGLNNIHGILVNDSTSFTNKGILNIEANGGSGSTIGLVLKNDSLAVAGQGYLGVDGKYYSAGNDVNGIINVGVNKKSSSGSTTGVLVDSAQSSFINEGEIHLGRTSQNVSSDPTTPTAVNQKKFLSGIVVQNNGTAVNTGLISLGSKVQNGIGMFANGGDDIQMRNAGEITLLNNDSLNVPNSNYGLLVQNAGKNGGIAHEGTINLQGINGIGLKVLGTGNNFASASTSAGSMIDINGAADPASGTRNYGVWVEGQGSQKATATLDGGIKLAGDGAIGIHARGEATVDVSNDAIPQFVNGKKQIGFFAYGDGAGINLTGGASVFDVSTDESTMFRLEDGADMFYSSNLELTTSGAGSKGIVGTGAGTVLNLMGPLFNVSGAGSTGLIVEGGAVARITNQAEFKLDGDSSVGILIDGEKHDLAGNVLGVVPSKVIAETKMTNIASNVTGIVVKNSSNLVANNSNTIELLAGTNNTGISVSGQNSTAENKGEIKIGDGTGMFITDNGMATGIGAITVNDGVAGLHLKDGGIVNVTSGTHSITTDGTAHGILLDTGAPGINLAGNTAIDIKGSGHGIENKAETSAITLKNATIDVTDGAGIRTAVSIDPTSIATVNVSGAGTGFAFVQEDMSSLTTGDLLLGPNYTFNVNGAGGTGIKALTSGNVQTSGTVNVNDSNGGPALLAGTAASTLNLGLLKSVSTTSPVVDLKNSTAGTIFENKGKILAANALATAIDGSAEADSIYMTAGQVRGDVNSGDGGDYLQFSGGTLDGSITMGDGINEALISSVSLAKTSHITSAKSGESSLIFKNIFSKGFGMAADDPFLGVNLGEGWNKITLDSSRFTLSGNLRLDDTVQDAELLIGSGSVLTASNNVNASISALGSYWVGVSNYGLIDLTTSKSFAPINSPKFKDTLNIRGNYDGRGGNLLLDTYLNAGGALSNQVTDRLFIHADVSGSTSIDFYLTQVPGMDSGAGTDLNSDGLIQNNEGISIVQVLGKANASSFKLKNGYVASGAFAYNLYSFDKASSDVMQNIINGQGNAFYDFRLANAFAVPLNRPQVAPQVASYLSQPMANAIYSNLIIDDLHKRLGELRYRKDEPNVGGNFAGNNEEDNRRIFLRFIGGDYDYDSSVSGNQFGFDFELKIQAMQLGFNLLDLADEDNDGLQAGIAWTHGKSTLTPDSPHDGYNRSRTDADTIGLYATYQREKNLYFDGVLAGTWSRSKINTKAYERANTLKTFAWSASIESGYSFFPTEKIRLEPQAQLIYFHENIKDTVDADGARVKYENNDQLVGRFGLRAAYEHKKDDGLKVTPYAVANYYTDFRASKPTVNISNNLPSSPGYDFKTGTYGDSIEGGLGLTIDAPTGVSVYMEADYRKGVNGNGLKGWRGDVGIKLSF